MSYVLVLYITSIHTLNMYYTVCIFLHREILCLIYVQNGLEQPIDAWMVSAHSVCRNAWKCKEGECTLCWVGAFPSFPAQLCSGNATWKVVDSVKGRKGLVLCNLVSESIKDNARTNKFVCSVCLLGQVTTLLWEAERALSWWVRMSGCTRDNKNMNLHQLLQATITQPPRLFISFAVHHDFEFQEYTE